MPHWPRRIARADSLVDVLPSGSEPDRSGIKQRYVPRRGGDSAASAARFRACFEEQHPWRRPRTTPYARAPLVAERRLFQGRLGAVGAEPVAA